MDNPQSLTNQFINNSFWSFLLAILNKLGGFIFTLILARFLLPEGFGVYSFILAIAMIFMAFGDLGINQALIILLSKNLKNQAKSKAYFRFLRNIKLTLLVIISLVFIIGTYLMSAHYFSKYNFPLLLIFCSIYIFFFSFSGFFTSFFFIYRKMKIDFFKELIFQSVRLLLILFVMLFLDKEFHLIGVFLALALSSFIMFFYSYFYSKKIALFSYIGRNYSSIDQKRVLKLLFYFMIGTLSLLLFSEIDILMIGILIKDLVYVGYYRAYFAIVLGVSGLLGFGGILLPLFSSFNKTRLKNVFDKVSKYVLILAFPASFGLFVLGSYFIKLFYGDNYVPGVFILYFLVFLIVSESLTNLFNIVISSRERPRFIAIALIISIVLNVLLTYFLIIFFLQKSIILAVSGAAIATLISRYFFMSCLWVYSSKNFGVSISIKLFMQSLTASILMAVPLYILSRSINMNLFMGVFLIVLGIGIYFVLMILFKSITREDKIIVDILYKKIKNFGKIKN